MKHQEIIFPTCSNSFLPKFKDDEKVLVCPSDFEKHYEICSIRGYLADQISNMISD